MLGKHITVTEWRSKIADLYRKGKTGVAKKVKKDTDSAIKNLRKLEDRLNKKSYSGEPLYLIYAALMVLLKYQGENEAAEQYGVLLAPHLDAFRKTSSELESFNPLYGEALVAYAKIFIKVEKEKVKEILDEIVKSDKVDEERKNWAKKMLSKYYGENSEDKSVAEGAADSKSPSSPVELSAEKQKWLGKLNELAVTLSPLSLKIEMASLDQAQAEKKEETELKPFHEKLKATIESSRKEARKLVAEAKNSDEKLFSALRMALEMCEVELLPLFSKLFLSADKSVDSHNPNKLVPTLLTDCANSATDRIPASIYGPTVLGNLIEIRGQFALACVKICAFVQKNDRSNLEKLACLRVAIVFFENMEEVFAKKIDRAGAGSGGKFSKSKRFDVHIRRGNTIQEVNANPFNQMFKMGRYLDSDKDNLLDAEKEVLRALANEEREAKKESDKNKSSDSLISSVSSSLVSSATDPEAQERETRISTSDEKIANRPASAIVSLKSVFFQSVHGIPVPFSIPDLARNCWRLAVESCSNRSKPPQKRM